MAVSLIAPLDDVPLAFIDVETTGSSPKFGERITEVAVLRVQGGQVVSRYSQLVNPQWRIAAGVVALTGITPEMVADQPTFAEQAPALLAALRGSVLVGHNVKFDLGFLAADFAHAGYSLADELGERTHVLDTVRIARKLFGRGGNGLQRLAARLGGSPSTAHRAMADCETTLFVLRQMLTPLGGFKLPLVDVLGLQGGAISAAAAVPAGRDVVTLPLELQEALTAKQPVEMVYLDARHRRTVRCVVPLSVSSRSGSAMLVAFCQLRNEQRTFRMDRVVGFRALSS
ncbi:MAG: exonuclease domain-containing protein [Phycisphaerae bacterium]